MKTLREFLCTCAAIGALALAVAGCGGGGGGGGSSSSGVFTYFTNFPAGTQNESEQITITLSGQTIATQTVTSNSNSANSQQAVFKNISNGAYIVTATLFSGANGTGNALGTAQASLSTTPTTMTTDVGATAASVKVTGSATSVFVNQTVDLAAEALDANNNEVFEASTPVWSVVPADNSIATVSQSGVVTGVAPGTATITAAYGSLQNSDAITVNSSTNAPGTWTIMLFLNASNSLDYFSYGNASLGVVGNVPQIESIANSATTTKFVMQWKLSPTVGSDIPDHPFNSTRRYLVTNNSLDLIQDLGQGVDMGSATTLQQFVQWAEATYPAQHYALIMWDHGNGWMRTFDQKKKPIVRAISEDDETGDIIDVWQLGPALAGSNLDIISFDACLMQMLEVQDEVASVAHYMVCSEDNTPGPGYPYDVCFRNFYTNPNDPVTTLAEGICNGSIQAYPPSSGYGPVSQSVIDLTKLPNVVTALGSFATALTNTGSSISSTVSSVRQASIPYDAADGYFYYDIGSVAKRFATANPNASVTTAANGLLTAQQAATVYSTQNGLSTDSTGMSFEFGNEPEFHPWVSDYANLKLANQDPGWPAFLNSTTLNPAP
jgi:hypothetical protein